MELVLPLISLVLMGYGSAGNASVHLFTHHTMLDKAGRVELSWTPGPEGITFRLEVAAVVGHCDPLQLPSDGS